MNLWVLLALGTALAGAALGVYGRLRERAARERWATEYQARARRRAAIREGGLPRPTHRGGDDPA